MQIPSVSRLSSSVVIQRLKSIVSCSNVTTAEMLVYIAEADARKLYVPAGYSSMFAYCLGELHMSEDQAYKRIHSARAARKFPAILDAVADGRLHLSVVCMLAAHLTDESAANLIEVATHKSKTEIERLLAERFPAPDLVTRLTALPARPIAAQLAPGQVAEPAQAASPVQFIPEQAVSPGVSSSAVQLAPGQVGKIAPLAPQRFALQATIPQHTHDKIRYAQELLGHEVPAGDIAQVLDMAMDELITKLEKRKFAACSKPRTTPGPADGTSRHIPARVKRIVWARDHGQCTFVSDSGKRCDSRRDLEFDHVEAFARGGKATTANIRLRCRAHNQYEAECTFGAGFMDQKRREVQAAIAASP